MATNSVSYFQSSLLAQEIENRLLGAIRFNAEQGLTEFQKAQARNNIGAVSFGSNLKILGHFDTVTELQAAAPRKIGDAYSVGTVTPYNLYIFDGFRNDWLDYGQIRAADISARYVENQAIAVSSWEQDDTVFTDYHYKARIVIASATADDFPIVAFAPKDAISGNFAPIAYAFDGYVEVWAKAIPEVDINIPVATVIVNGGNGSGVTNASGGISTGGIVTDNLADGAVTGAKIADGAVSQTFTATITADGWTGESAPYTNAMTVTGLLATDNPLVDMIPSDTFETAETEIEAYANIYKMVSGNNQLTVYAAEKPTVDISIQLKAVRK